MSKNVALRSDWLLTSEVFPHEIIHILVLLFEFKWVFFFHLGRSSVRYCLASKSCAVFVTGMLQRHLVVVFVFSFIIVDRQTYWLTDGRTDGVVVLIIRMTFFFTAWISFVVVTISVPA